MLEALTEPVLHCTFLTASPLIVSVIARGFFFCFFGLFFCVFFCSSLICGWIIMQRGGKSMATAPATAPEASNKGQHARSPQ